MRAQRMYRPLTAQTATRSQSAAPAVMLTATEAGRTPKQTMSQRESSWIPKRFSSSVDFLRVRAILPSNISQMPEAKRQNRAVKGSPVTAKPMPTAEIKRLTYVRITV